jgi:hypothetical protein
MAEKLCPVCGAYWKCDCVVPPPPSPPEAAPPIARRRTRSKDLIIDARQPETAPTCDHDWVDAVGVELFDDIDIPEARIMVCRLCGLYAVEQEVGN